MSLEASIVLWVGLNLEINSVPQTHYTIGRPKRGAENFPCLNPSLLLSKRLKREGLTFRRHSFSEFRNPGVGGFQKAPVNTMQSRRGKCVRVPRRHEEKQSNVLLPPGAEKKKCATPGRQGMFHSLTIHSGKTSWAWVSFVCPATGWFVISTEH